MSDDIYRDARRRVLVRGSSLLIGLSGIAAILLLVSRANFVPIWDGRTYADCIVRAARSPHTPDAFRCIGHTSQAFVGVAALLQQIDIGNPLLIVALNAALFIVAVIAFRRLCVVVFPGDSALVDRALLTCAFIVQPAFLAAIVQPSIDLPLLPEFLWCLVLLWRRRMTAAVLLGVIMTFTKETGLLLYAALIASYAIWQLLVNPERRRERLESVLRLAPLVIPALVFAAYLGIRSVTHSAPLMGTSAGTGSSFFGQLLVPRLDLYLVNFLVITLILNCAWIATVPIALDAFVGVVRRAHKLERRSLGGADASAAAFILTVLVVVAFALSRFITYGNVRYYLIVIALIPVIFLVTLCRNNVGPRWRWLALGVYISALLVSNVRTIDPLSRRIYGTFKVGEHHLLTMTRITGECCGNGQDQLAYNLQFTALHDLVDDALGATAGGDTPPVILPDSTAWFQIGPLDSHLRRRTLRHRDVVMVSVTEAIAAVRDSLRPERAIFIALPNGPYERGLADLRRVYDIGSERQVVRGGYALSVWDLRRRERSAE